MPIPGRIGMARKAFEQTARRKCVAMPSISACTDLQSMRSRSFQH